ncbi:VanZ family protein [Paenarthrobacter nitroguajacolicus]|uniref:VanZ family protein n=1 Tax=Paenarthrobacter nitroguajacolicus TaxID=211146 RepID=UPI003440BEF6
MKNPLTWRIALTTYLAGLALVAYWPTPVDRPVHGTITTILKYLHTHGVPRWFDYHFVEASANVAMFIPLGVFAAMAMPSKAGWHIAVIGLLASLCMEVGQLIFISARFSSLVDVVTNVCGAVIGIVAARVLAPIGSRRLTEA